MDAIKSKLELYLALEAEAEELEEKVKSIHSQLSEIANEVGALSGTNFSCEVNGRNVKVKEVIQYSLPGEGKTLLEADLNSEKRKQCYEYLESKYSDKLKYQAIIDRNMALELEREKGIEIDRKIHAATLQSILSVEESVPDCFNSYKRFKIK
jgi:hypothetical protein